MTLFDFAYCCNFNGKISQLAELCPEKWSFGTNSDNVILRNYINHTFMKVYSEGKVIEKENYALFNTGLFTEYYEPIYAYFVKNKVPEKQKWFLDNFYSAYQLTLMGITDTPARANYFSSPELLVFNTNYNIVPQYSHIFKDAENYLRLPESIRNSQNATILFDGALQRARAMIDANYKTAVPQYHKENIQLLIPICLTSENVPDLALVVSKKQNDNVYIGHTCLSLDMAYSNARLIARPDSVWLHP